VALILVVEDEAPIRELLAAMMPVLSGVELCRRLKGDPATAAIPVILMSAVDARHAGEAGADAFVPKPFELDRLEALIDGWLAAR
jgi:CheY-like chemotaxis protein